MRWYSDLNLFQEDWFSELSSKHKVLWHYLSVSCNVAGIWSPNFKTASALTGEKFSDSDLKAFGARIRRLQSGKILLVGYATEQWGDLSSNQGIHKKILGLLKAEGLEISDLSVVYPHLYSATPEYTREGEGEREGVQKEKGYGEKETESSSKIPPPKEILVPFCEEHGVDPERFFDYYQTQGWCLANGRKMKDWESAVRQWARRGKSETNGHSFAKPNLSTHPGNPEWIGYKKDQVTEDQKAEFLRLKKQQEENRGHFTTAQH